MGDKTPATTTQNQNSTSTSSPYAPAVGMINNLISKYSNVSTDPTQAQTNAVDNLVNSASGVPSFVQPSSDAVNSMFGNAGMLNSNLDTLKANLGGMASGAQLNPYSTPGFSDSLSTLTNDITNQVKGVYAGSGRDPTGAGSFAGSLARGLVQGEAPVLQSQYNTNVGNMLNANNTLYNAGNTTVGALDNNTSAALANAGLLPGLAGNSAQLSAANTQQALPYQDLLQQLQAAGIFGGMGGTTTSTGSATGTQAPANNPLANWIGGLSAGAGLIGSFSDPRLKTDVKKVGKLHDGQNVYSYRFKGSNVPQIGLLADEVEKKAPEAVARDPATGYKTVRYDIATRKAAGRAPRAKDTPRMGMLAA